MNPTLRSGVPGLTLVAVILLGVPACAPAQSPGGGSAASASATPAASASRTGPAVCPNEHGGVCLGELSAGEYTTRSFVPALTYTVSDGWSNLEDLEGNFLLVPPDGDLAGVDLGTSDYIGVFTHVNAIEGCEATQVDVPHTPKGFVDWLHSNPGFDVTNAAATSVGGLDGFVVDLRMVEGWSLVCPYSQGQPVLPLMIGVRPSSLEHVLTPDQTTRLWVLGYDDSVLAIELAAIDTHDQLEDLTAVVQSFRFGPD